MTGQQLRNSILQLAIQGKLVAQDPKDEPASALLRRIAEERAALPGKRKAPPSRIERRPDGTFEVYPDGSEKDISDEIPCDIPQSWEWVRIQTIAEVERGGSPRPIKSFITHDASGINWIKIGDSDRDSKYILSTREKIKPEGERKSRRVYPGDLLLSNSMSYGRPYILKIDGCIHDGWLVLHPRANTFSIDYLYYALTSAILTSQFAELAKGSTVSNLNKERVGSAFLPLPPLREQQRIVAKIESLLPLVERYGRKQERLLQLNEALPKHLRQSLLQAAIEGKLVAQDPKEEPASALLERITKERAALPGKRKAAPPSRIERRPGGIFELFPDGSEKDISDEIPFDIPESWEWVRLESVCTYIQRGKSPKYSEIVKIPVISQKCIQWSGFTIEKARFIDPESLSSYNRERFLEDGDLLLNSTGTGTIGRMAIYMSDLNPYGVALADGHVTVVRPYKDFVLNRFICTLFASPQIQSQIEKKSDGSTNQIEFSLSKVKETLVPLPPLQEQQRIVQRLEELLPLVSQA